MQVQYLRALDWGMRWARPPVAERLLDPECFVHHTAGALISEDAATAFRTLNEYAIGTKGYSALDYDVLVHYSPARDLLTLGEGRGPWMSAATLDRNEQGEAVCVMGYFHPGHKLSRQPFPEEIEGVALGVAWGMDMGWIARNASIMGHRQNPAHVGATGCPGDYLYAHMPTIRARVAALTAAPVLGPPPPPAPVIVPPPPAPTPAPPSPIPAPPATPPRFRIVSHHPYRITPIPVRIEAGQSATFPTAPFPPATARGAIINITVVGPDGPGYVVAYADGTPTPPTSNVSWSATGTHSGAGAVQFDPTTKRVRVLAGAAGCSVLLDQQAWTE
jgi:hypothetical protein